MNNQIRVINRKGEVERCKLDEITNRIKKAHFLSNIDSKDINPVLIASKVSEDVIDLIKTTELDEITSRICMESALKSIDYKKLASMVTINNHQKNCPKTFSEAIELCSNVQDKYNESYSLISEETLDIVRRFKDTLNEMVEDQRDFYIDYFGFKTLQKSYLLKDPLTDQIFETPQYMWLRVSVGIHGENMKKVKNTYDLMSCKFFTHASPTLFNSGTRFNNFISCFLLHTDDSIEGIYKTISDCAFISKYSGGIGVHISNIRSNNSIIRGTGGKSDGIVKMLRVYNDTACYINQGGKRLGSFAMYLEPWHADIFEFLEAKRNHGSEYGKSRDLFYGLWIPDLFMETVKNLGDWYLMCPDTSKGLNNVYGKEFEQLYNKYIEEGKYIKKIKATDLWNKICLVQIETGMPYMCYKDHVNRKSNQANIGTIKSSNLCVAPETRILTKEYGYVPIFLVENKLVNVWNGEKWSKTKPIKTSPNEKLLRIEFSNGSKLECTEYHKFYIVENNKTIKVDAKDLEVGMKLIKHNPCVIKKFKKELKNAYSLGLYCSDKTFNDGYPSGEYYVPNPYSIDSKIKWFEGFVDGDGYIENFNLRIFNKNKLLLDDIRLMLQSIGVESFLTDKTLIINTYNIKKLIDHGFSPKRILISKHDKYSIKINNNILNIKDTDYSKHVQVTAIIDDQRYSDTYCFKENERGMGMFEGILTGNCSEITLYSGEDEYACCNLASIKLDAFLESPKIENVKIYGTTKCIYCKLAHAYLNDHDIKHTIVNIDDPEIKSMFFEKYNCKTVPQIFIGEQKIDGFSELIKVVKKSINWEKFRHSVHTMVENLDIIIDINRYPVPETRNSNFRHRPIGLGVQGLSNLFEKLWIAYDSDEAKQLNKEVFERLYYYAVEKSIELAKEKGHYSTFNGSPISQGKFQFDLWSVEPSLDWEKLRSDVKKYGIRNSTLISLMPTASTSQILTSNEGFEPITSNLYRRTTLAGEFVVVTDGLIKKLSDIGMWDEMLKNKVIYYKGSIQKITSIPQIIRDIYKTTWEISKRDIIDMAADRGPFICQSQSLNMYCPNPTPQLLSKIHMYTYQKGLKTGSYYIRSKAVDSVQNVSLDPLIESELSHEDIEYEQEDACVSCSG